MTFIFLLTASLVTSLLYSLALAVLVQWLAARVHILELERTINQRGYFLRDDLPIRTTKDGSTTFEGREQAYSLFSKQPYERHGVYGGPLPWAVEQAHKQVMEQT